MEPEQRGIRFADFGLLILRLGVGGLMLLHGINKVQNGIDGLFPLLQAHNLPDQLAYGVYAGEVAAPILIILGIFTRLGGLLLAGNMAFAVYLMHLNQLTTLDPLSGGYALELQALYFIGGLTLLFTGAGKIGLARGHAPLD